MRDELEVLPGVGPSIAGDLRSLGVQSVHDLARRDPERLYRDLCTLSGERQDPCVLYTFRCAVYAARSERPEPGLLRWWAWKDRRLESIVGMSRPARRGVTSRTARRVAGRDGPRLTP